MSAPTALESSGNTSSDPPTSNVASMPPSGKSTQVKLVLLGESAVGKSSLVLRFVKNEFSESNTPTIGASFLSQKCEFKDNDTDTVRTVKFEIWDTAGQERFHSLAPMYYRQAKAAIVVYDVTKAATLEKAKSWIKELQRQADPNIVIALAGNKIDLVEDSDVDEEQLEADGSNNANNAKERREVPTEEAQAYAQDAKILFFETSARKKINIDDMFKEIAANIPEVDHTRTSNGRNSNSRVDLMDNHGMNRSGGCAC